MYNKNMRKKGLTFHFITLMLFCQPFLAISGTVSAISEAQTEAIVGHCETNRESLKSVQKVDSRVRVYLGSYYEKILSKFITQLNVRMVENNLSDMKLIENQAAVAAAREKFNEDFVVYQKGLEDLIMVDCAAEPERFYEELLKVREERAVVREDAMTVRERILEHVTLVKAMLKEGE